MRKGLVSTATIGNLPVSVPSCRCCCFQSLYSPWGLTSWYRERNVSYILENISVNVTYNWICLFCSQPTLLAHIQLAITIKAWFYGLNLVDFKLNFSSCFTPKWCTKSVVSEERGMQNYANDMTYMIKFIQLMYKWMFGAQQKLLSSIIPSNSCFTELLSRISFMQNISNIFNFL